MKKYIAVEIENIEPVKIGAGGSKENQVEPTKDYIPGATIRGAFIAQLIKKGKFEPGCQKDILSGMFFYNAYPFENDKIYTPVPVSLRIDKHEWRRRSLSSDFDFVKVANLAEDEGKADIKNAIPHSFMCIRENMFEGMSVNKEYRFHHNSMKRHGEKERENIFRYEAISKGQRFRSLICFDSAMESLVERILKNETRMYLGGSKGSGYGLCRVRTVEGVKNSYGEVKKILGIEAEKNLKCRHITLTCLSDCLFRNEFGQPVNHMTEKEIKELTGMDVERAEIFVKSRVTEGYNMKWGERYPKESVVGAGSVMKYEIQGDASYEDVSKAVGILEERLAGYRNVDGYGWLDVNSKYPHMLRPRKVENKAVSEFEKAGKAVSLEEVRELPEFKVIIDGFGQAKENWLRSIAAMSIFNMENEPVGLEMRNMGAEIIVLQNGMEASNMDDMLNQLDMSIKAVANGKKAGRVSEKLLGEEYCTDSRLCSIKGVEFAQIIRYVEDDNRIPPKSKKTLDKYAQQKLSTKKGGLFYMGKSGEKRLFIGELMKEALYIQKRRKSDEQGD